MQCYLWLETFFAYQQRGKRGVSGFKVEFYGFIGVFILPLCNYVEDFRPVLCWQSQPVVVFTVPENENLNKIIFNVR